MTHIVKILMTETITHNVKRFVVEKPAGYRFTPGQATDVAINEPGWKDNTHPFTFTQLNDALVLEFTIKGYPVKDYPTHDGMTEHLHTLSPGAELLIGNPWGTIQYKGSGVFLAAGAGITPFIAIFRQLYKDRAIGGNTLVYSNKTAADVILEPELKIIFGSKNARMTTTLTREKNDDYRYGRIDEKLLSQEIKEWKQHFYVCGPKQFTTDMKSLIQRLGGNSQSVVFEE